jgi:hypothetical protein
MRIEELDRPPAGWHPLTVMRRKRRGGDWVALMIDVDPNEYPRGASHKVQECWVRIPGKYRNHDEVWSATWDLIEGGLH